jgi:hypothetical protein
MFAVGSLNKKIPPSNIAILKQLLIENLLRIRWQGAKKNEGNQSKMDFWEVSYKFHNVRELFKKEKGG